MKICIISGGYPSEGRPEYAFVEQLSIELAKSGNEVTVIAPESLTKRILRKLDPIQYKRIFQFDKGSVTVYSPKYYSFGGIGKHFNINASLFSKSVCKTLKHLNFCPDVIYGHFWHNAYAAYPFAVKHNIPLFVASGEAEIEQNANSDKEIKFCDYVKGVICVSTKNKNESIERGLLKNAPCAVIPNAIDGSLFYKLDKKSCRAKLNIEDSDFVVAFVGNMIYRKGPDRVSDAIDKLNDDTIKSFFIGTNKDGADIVPTCDGILHYGPLSHEQIPKYLNASDVFVLPTLHEGCCNAIVEAMACGLPIISSDRDFNMDILDRDNAILIDPMSINEISKAISVLKNDVSKRASMSLNSLEKVKSLNIESRAKRILSFIKSNI